MKKTLLATFLMLMSFVVLAQEVKVPEKINQAFLAKNELANVAYWEIVEGKYRVFFEVGGKFQYAMYDPTTNSLIETGTFVEKSLPNEALIAFFMKKLNLLQLNEVYTASNNKGDVGFLLVGEDEENKQEMFITDKQKIVRTFKSRLLTSKEKEERKKTAKYDDPKNDEVKW
jgi:hypothetical protein